MSLEVNQKLPVPLPVTGSNFSGTFSPSGLKNGGKYSEVVLSAVAWTPLPATPLADRNAICIQNISPVDIKLNYDYTGPLPAGYTGVLVPSGAERFYDITDAIVIYAKAASGTPTIGVEEIS
jgi:hypothetical protein